MYVGLYLEFSKGLSLGDVKYMFFVKIRIFIWSLNYMKTYRMEIFFIK